MKDLEDVMVMVSWRLRNKMYKTWDTPRNSWVQDPRDANVICTYLWIDDHFIFEQAVFKILQGAKIVKETDGLQELFGVENTSTFGYVWNFLIAYNLFLAFWFHGCFKVQPNFLESNRNCLLCAQSSTIGVCEETMSYRNQFANVFFL